jgi:hypothetical protein
MQTVSCAITSVFLFSPLDRKEQLIAALIKADAESPEKSNDTMSEEIQEKELSADELVQLSIITEEMRHLRRQWLLQSSRQGQFSHQGYGSSRK